MLRCLFFIFIVMEAKTVLFFIPTTTWGGVEKNVKLRVQFLLEEGHQPVVVLLNNQFKEEFSEFPNCRIESVNRRGGDANPFVLKRYIEIIKTHQPDVVFAASKKDWWLVSWAAYWQKVHRIIVYLGIRRTLNSIKYKILFSIVKPTLLVNSLSLQSFVIKHYDFLSLQNVTCIYNGFPAVKLKQERLLKQELGLSESVYLVGLLGRFSHQKGFDLVPQIAARTPTNIHFVIAGNGELKQELEHQFSTAEHKERLHILPYQTEKNAYLAGLDLFLLTSRWEGMANVLNEALSNGLPVVATNVDGTAEVLSNGKYGSIVPIEDVEALAKAIQKLYSKEISFSPEAQKQWIEQQFSLKKMKRQTFDLFFGTSDQ